MPFPNGDQDYEFHPHRETAHQQANNSFHYDASRSDVFDQDPESMILQSAQQLTNPNGYNLDPALGGGLSQSHSYPDPSQYASMAPQGPPSATFGNFEVPTAHMMDSQQSTPAPESQPKAAAKPSKAKATSLQNDLELRKMFEKEKHRSLQDVAAQLVNNERGPNSEKMRQTFAMIWYVTNRPILFEPEY